MPARDDIQDFAPSVLEYTVLDHLHKMYGNGTTRNRILTARVAPEGITAGQYALRTFVLCQVSTDNIMTV